MKTLYPREAFDGAVIYYNEDGQPVYDPLKTAQILCDQVKNELSECQDFVEKNLKDHFLFLNQEKN